MKAACALFLMLALLVAPRVGDADPPRVPLIPTLQPHPDLVSAGPYAPIEAGEANWGTGVAGEATAREFFTRGNQFRIRQTGTIRRIRLNVQDPAGLTGFYFRVWRQIGPTYDLVGSSENLAPRMTAGMNSLDLQRPIVAQEGDFYGYRVESGAAANFFALMKRSGVVTHSVVADALRPNDFDWQAQPGVAASALPIEMSMEAPILVAIGDGMVIGHFDHKTLVELTPSKYPGTDLLTYLGDRWRVTRQNVGAHAQTIRQIAARFTQDVVSLKPRIALIGAGTYDLVLGSPLKLEEFLAYHKAMLDACQANDIKPLVMLLSPSITQLTAAQSQKRDQWNAALRELVSRYPRAVVIDISTYVGTPRPAGPSGNLWNTKTEYLWTDRVHLNDAGIRQVVQAIVDQYTEP